VPTKPMSLPFVDHVLFVSFRHVFLYFYPTFAVSLLVTVELPFSRSFHNSYLNSRFIPFMERCIASNL
jgi:hypothetical protein